MMEASTAQPNEGLRKRKRRETGERIAETALTLFSRDGFEDTTLASIAEAADVSRRTLFHYFPSKEAIVEAQEARFEALLRPAAARSLAETPLGAALEAILQVVGRYETEEVLALERLVHCSPQLMARRPAGWERKEKLLCEGLAVRWPDPARTPSLRLAAMAAVGSLRLAMEVWRDEADKRSPADHVVAEFERLKEVLVAYAG